MTEGDPVRDEWLKKLFSGSIPSESTPFFRVALDQIESNGEKLVPGSAWDDPTTSPTNIFFLQCRPRGYQGEAYMVDQPKKAIFLCDETFEPLWRKEKLEEMIKIITHEMIHWIDRESFLFYTSGLVFILLYSRRAHVLLCLKWVM